MKQTAELNELEQFDYDNLRGESFKAYNEIALNKPADKEIEYTQFNAVGEFKWRINEDTGEREEYLNGIRLVNTKPINHTKIPSSYARLMNEQIYAKHGERNSRYYLLKK